MLVTRGKQAFHRLSGSGKLTEEEEKMFGEGE
jgi:hypothetical protein